MNNEVFIRFEIMDRAFIQQEQFEQAFKYHPLAGKTKKLHKKICNLLGELYQSAAKDFDEVYEK